VIENREGFNFMKDHKYAEAAARFQKAVQIDARNKKAWNNLGVCELRLYETGLSGTPALESAVTAFQKVAELDPAHKPENLASAQAFMTQEKAWAEAAAKRAGQPARTPAATGDYRAYKAAGEAAEAEGDMPFAQANYERAEGVATSAKGKSAAANFQGLLALRRRDPKAAVDHLKRATGLDPANRYAWNNLGVALRLLFDAGAGGKELIEEAVAAFRKVSEIDPAYKPENLAEAEALLAELGGPSAPPAEAVSATTAEASGGGVSPSGGPAAAPPGTSGSGETPKMPAAAPATK
jgi:tetratricopeptide (TPR) repeat protein